MNEVGYVISSRDYLMYLDGLPTISVSDLVENEQGVRGVATSLHEAQVEAWILDEGQILPGQLFKRTDKKLHISVSNNLLGRAINPLGIPIDGKGIISQTRAMSMEMDSPASGLTSREFINQQLITGVSLIDTLIPIGKGQRQLVIGDARSGKTSFLVDVVTNQTKLKVVCIWASIGKPITELRSIIDTLATTKALANTVVIAASSTDPTPLIYLTPQAALTVAEYFQKQGLDVLVILDDMGVHAKIYRELSLLGNRPPGRESYPGDIFFAQAHLLERAGKFNPASGGGSITALPVVELNLNDFTGFIPTNLMAMTDGHFLFKAASRAQGQHPAIDISLSVSRVGRQTQPPVVSLLSQKLRSILAEASSLETVSRFSSETSSRTQLILRQSELIKELIKHDSLTFIPQEMQLALFGLILTSRFADKDKKYLVETAAKIPNLLKIKSLEELTAKLERIRL